MRIFTAPTIIWLLYLSTAPALAQNRPPQHGPIPFEGYDKDNNGMVTEQEFNDVRAKRLAELANQGRRIPDPSRLPSFAQFDANKDGLLTKEELIAGQQAHMQRRREEMMRRAQMVPGQSVNALTDPQGCALAKPFAELDLDRSGSLSEQEFNTARAACPLLGPAPSGQPVQMPPQGPVK